MNDDEELEDIETGPFCRHWGDPSDCDERCEREGCNHKCIEHNLDNGETNCRECNCEAWVGEL